MKTHVKTPAKVILSGEYSAVYRKLAIGYAIQQQQCFTEIKNNPNSNNIVVELANFNQTREFSYLQVISKQKRLKKKYLQYFQNNYNKVLNSIFDLPCLTIASFASLLNIKIEGIKIHINSSISLKCGLGSSASCIMCIIIALENYFDIKLDSQTRLRIALSVENFQHLPSSGLDLTIINDYIVNLPNKDISTFRFIKYKKNQPYESINLNYNPNFILINTGTPISSTSQCIANTKPYFMHNKMLTLFENTTKNICDALIENNVKKLKTEITNNNKLLTIIGCVSKKVQNFIHEIELLGGAAKTSTGSIEGENCGIIIALSDCNLDNILKKYNFNKIHN